MLATDEFYCIGDEQEVKNFERELFIDDEELLNIYLELSVENKRIVNNVLRELTGNRDFFGYNLERILKAYKNAAPKVAQLKISSQILHDAQYIDEKFADSIRHSSSTEKSINNHIDIAKQSVSLSESPDAYKNNLEYYVQAICEYLLIDMELIKNGIGKVYDIKDEWFDTYMTDSQFRESADDDIANSWSTRLHIKKYEEYLRAQGKLSNEDSILEEKWAVMTYSGAYMMLKKQKGTTNEVKAVE